MVKMKVGMKKLAAETEAAARKVKIMRRKKVAEGEMVNKPEKVEKRSGWATCMPGQHPASASYCLSCVDAKRSLTLHAGSMRPLILCWLDALFPLLEYDHHTCTWLTNYLTVAMSHQKHCVAPKIVSTAIGAKCCSILVTSKSHNHDSNLTAIRRSSFIPATAHRYCDIAVWHSRLRVQDCDIMPSVYM